MFFFKFKKLKKLYKIKILKILIPFILSFEKSETPNIKKETLIFDIFVILIN